MSVSDGSPFATVRPAAAPREAIAPRDVEPAAERAAGGGFWTKLDAWVAVAGEKFNPILVKEARQALKSKHFTITFTLLLLCAWIVSMLGVALIGPAIYYSNDGPGMFYGYFLVLAFALLIIVPYGAFRSLASEREDRTFELLAITTLGPRQIVAGKLNSAILQMLVYFSAIAPCLAFTYMLRGIDFPTILVVLVYTFLGSLGLSMFGLLLATATKEKHWQIVLSVALVLGLAAAWGFGIFMAFMAIQETMPFRYSEFWMGNAAVISGYAACFYLLFQVATAQLTFESENRSTPIRVAMLTIHAVLAGWMGWVWFYPATLDYAAMIIYLSLATILWYVMGTFLTGESPDLSPRVKRKLPQSFLGRICFTWLNPGPATGYFFVLGNLFAAVVLVLGVTAGVWLSQSTSSNFLIAPARSFAQLLGFSAVTWAPNEIESIVFFALFSFCYVAIYLGIGHLISRGLGKLAMTNVFLTLLLNILLLVGGCGVPLTIHLMTRFRDDYSILEASNPFWTLAETADGLPLDGWLLLLVLPLLAASVIMANLLLVLRDVRFTRVASPTRVAADDVALAAARAPIEPVRTSPWD